MKIPRKTGLRRSWIDFPFNLELKYSLNLNNDISFRCIGSSEKVERVVNWYFDEKKFNRKDNKLKYQTVEMLMDFFKPNLKDGWESVSLKSLSLERVIYPFLKELKKNQKEVKINLNYEKTT